MTAAFAFALFISGNTFCAAKMLFGSSSTTRSLAGIAGVGGEQVAGLDVAGLSAFEGQRAARVQRA